jgi:hypothetical protein
MYNAAKEVFSKVVSAIGDKISDVTSKVGELGTAAKNKLSNFISSFSSIGGQLISGLWSGISDKAQWLYDKITGMGSTVVSKVKKLFGIKSPSKVFAEIGNYLAEGLGVGWEDGIVDVMDDIEADLKIPDAEINANTIGELTYQVGDLEANNQTEQLNAILGILTTYLPECSAGLNIDGEKLTNSLNKLVVKICGRKRASLSSRLIFLLIALLINFSLAYFSEIKKLIQPLLILPNNAECISLLSSGVALIP